MSFDPPPKNDSENGILSELPNGTAIPPKYLKAKIELSLMSQCLIKLYSIFINWENSKSEISLFPSLFFLDTKLARFPDDFNLSFHCLKFLLSYLLS